MDEKLQDAIIQTESSGRPNVEGDEGKSHGLMQIQEDTAKGLHRQGLLPEKWNGKKVKRRDLTKLLKDPEFNKLAGTALYVDNKNRLKSIANKNGIQYTQEQLNDWAIKAHNQGVTKTIRRELLGQEPILPKVDDYLNRIKNQINSSNTPKLEQGYENGGVVGENPMEMQIAQEIAQTPEEIDNIVKNLEMAKNADQNPNIEPETASKIIEFYNIFMTQYNQASSPEEKQKVLDGLSVSLDDFSKKYGTGIPVVEMQLPEQLPNFADGGLAPVILNPNYKQSNSYSRNDEPPLTGQMSGPDRYNPEFKEFLYNVEQTQPSTPPMSQMSEEQRRLLSLGNQEKENNEGVTPTEKKVAQDLGKTKIQIKDLEEEMASARKADLNPEIPEQDKDQIKLAYEELINDYKNADKEKNKAKKLRSLLKLSKAISNFGLQYGKGKAMVAGQFDVKAPELGIEIPSVEELYQGPDIKNLEGRLKLLRELKGKQLSEKDKFYMKLAQQQLDQRKREGELNRDLRKENQKLQKEKEDRILNQQQINTAHKFINQDPRLKDTVKQAMAFENVDNLMSQITKEGNEAAVPALGAQLARAMGEVGVLTDADVVRYLGGKSWGRKIMDWYKGGMEGTLSSSTIKDLTNNIKQLRGVAGKRLNTIYGNAHERMKTAFPTMDNERIKGLIGSYSGRSVRQEEPKENPRVREYADTYFKGDYNKAYNLLKKRGAIK